MRILTEHWASLPKWHEHSGKVRAWPAWLLFVGLPLVVALPLGLADLSAEPAAIGGLLAGIGVLGGLLFQVLAWVAGRIGSLADSTGDQPPDDSLIDLVQRLDVARANLAYAATLSIVVTASLGVFVMLNDAPGVLAIVAVFLLMHLVLTLVLVVARINDIGAGDRVATLTNYVRKR